MARRKVGRSTLERAKKVVEEVPEGKKRFRIRTGTTSGVAVEEPRHLEDPIFSRIPTHPRRVPPPRTERNHLVESEERRIAELRTLDQVIAEARRVSAYPRWVHVASLYEIGKMIEEREGRTYTLTQFHGDVKPTVGITAYHTWVRCYNEVWRKLSPKLRRETQKVSYYRAVLNHPKYVSGAWSVEKVFMDVVDSGAATNLLYTYVKAVRSFITLVKKHPRQFKLFVKQVNEDVLRQTLADLQEVDNIIRTEMPGLRKKRKSSKAA